MAKLDWEREIEALVAKNITRETHGGAVNRVRYTLTQQLQQLIDKARLSEAEWWNSNIDFVAWEKRLTQLKDQLNAKGEKK